MFFCWTSEEPLNQSPAVIGGAFPPILRVSNLGLTKKLSSITLVN